MIHFTWKKESEFQYLFPYHLTIHPKDSDKMTSVASSSNHSLLIEKMPASIPYFLNEQLFAKMLSDDSSLNRSDEKHSPTAASNTISPVGTNTSSSGSKERRARSNRGPGKALSPKPNYYTLAGHTQQNSRQFTRFHYQPVGTFLTQYKIRENYKFLQMISVPPLDPAVPKPEGGTSVPACGEPLLVPSSFPQSLEAAIHKFANSSSKPTSIMEWFFLRSLKP
jgi:hypothetical protein